MPLRSLRLRAAGKEVQAEVYLVAGRVQVGRGFDDRTAREIGELGAKLPDDRGRKVDAVLDVPLLECGAVSEGEDCDTTRTPAASSAGSSWSQTGQSCFTIAKRVRACIPAVRFLVCSIASSDPL